MNRCPTSDGFDRPCRNRCQLPGTKANDAHLVSFCDLFPYGFREGVNDGIRLFQVHMSPSCDKMGEFLFPNDLRSLGIFCWHKLSILSASGEENPGVQAWRSSTPSTFL